MTLIRTVAPPVLPIDEAAVFAHLRLILDDSLSPDPAEADLVRGYIKAACALLDGPGGMLARCLISQAWQLKLPRFPRGPITIPLPPVSSVSSVAYLDPSGASQTLDAGAYVVAGIGSDDVAIHPAPGASWPAVRSSHPEAVTITFTAGYGATADDVPEPIRGALLEMIADRYAFRESISAGVSIDQVPATAQDALSSFVSYRGLING